MERRSTSLIIYGFALITVLYFIPGCLAARQLLDFPPQYNPVGEDHEHDDQSKSGVHGSVSDHAGSATGDTPPGGGVNGPPSPTSYNVNNNRVTNGRNCQVVQTVDAYGNKKTVTSGNGCNNNGNYVGGQQNGEAYYYYYYSPGSENGNSGYP